MQLFPFWQCPIEAIIQPNDEAAGSLADAWEWLFSLGTCTRHVACRPN